MEKRVLYGFKLKGKDELLRLERIYNGDYRYASNEYKFYLVEKDKYNDYPEFLVENKDDLINIKNNKNMETQWYNSTSSDPVISFDLDELEIVKVETNYEVI